MKKIILSKRGIAILELLIALSIASILAAFAMGIYLQGLKITRLIRSDADVYEGVRKIFHILPSDIKSVSPPSSSLTGEMEKRFKLLTKEDGKVDELQIIGTNPKAYKIGKIQVPRDTITLSTICKRNLHTNIHAPKCIVEYYWKGLFESVLIRKETYIDEEGEIKSKEPKEVGRNIIGMNLRYREKSHKGEWLEEWARSDLPSLIELSLYTKRAGIATAKIFTTYVVIPKD